MSTASRLLDSVLTTIDSVCDTELADLELICERVSLRYPEESDKVRIALSSLKRSRAALTKAYMALVRDRDLVVVLELSDQLVPNEVVLQAGEYSVVR